MTNTTAQTSPDSAAATVEEAMWMLQDVPGDTLIERIARLTKWYQDLCVGHAPRSQQSIKTEPDAVQCARCNGDQFVSGAWPDMPDEPCPVCNSGAPSGAERVRLAALSDTSTDGHTRFCAIHTVGDCTCSVSPPERQP